MKIRHPQLLKLAGLGIALVVRHLIGTVRYHCVSRGRPCEPTVPGLRERFIYSFWHENILLCGCRYAYTPTHVLISNHRDGEAVAQACRHIGLKTVRASTGKRGAVQAVRDILRLGGKRHIVFTPDGPRGPRRVLQPGLIYTASRTGLPIVPVGFGYRLAWRLSSWDRFAIPVPFSPAAGVVGSPIEVPADLDRRGLEEWTAKVQQAMEDVTREAEERGAKARW